MAALSLPLYFKILDPPAPDVFVRPECVLRGFRWERPINEHRREMLEAHISNAGGVAPTDHWSMNYRRRLLMIAEKPKQASAVASFLARKRNWRTHYRRGTDCTVRCP